MPSPSYVPVLSTRRLPDWFYTRVYGAVGDGIADDTQAIQSALDAARDAGGGVVYLASGTYKISSALVLYNNITLLGDGVGVTTIVQSSTSAHGLTGSNLELVTLQDLSIDGPGSGTGRGINFVGTVIIYSFYINMTRVMVKQFGSHGIYIDDPVTSVLTNVTSKENGGEGFYIRCSDLGTVGTSTSLIGCYSHNNASNGYRLNNMVYSTFTGCAADHNINGYKIEVSEVVTLTGCGAEENTGDSIQIQGGNTISVIGAWISETGTNGVHVTSNARNITLKGIKEFSSGGATSFIDVDAGCSGVTIENCISDTLSNSLAAGTTQALPDTGFVAAATTPGTVTGKMEVFDASGNSLGFLPVYDAIT